MGRPRDTDSVRAEKRAALLAWLQPVLDVVWLECDGGPTLADVAERAHRTEKALAREIDALGLSWWKLRQESHARVLGVDLERAIARLQEQASELRRGGELLGVFRVDSGDTESAA
jgi:hypothetical protein